MWILTVLSFALVFHGGFCQFPEVMNNPFVMRAMLSGGSGGATVDPMTLMLPSIIEGGGAAGQMFALNALRGAGRNSGNSGLLNLMLLNPEMMSGGAANRQAMMYYMLSQDPQTSTPPTARPTVPGRPKTGTINATKPATGPSSGSDLSGLLQLLALSGGAETSSLGAMAALMAGGAGSGPLSPMSVLRPEQYSSLMREGASTYPQYAKLLCRLPRGCRMPMCAEPITTYSKESYFTCPECPKCPHDIMMEMFNGGGPGSSLTGPNPNPIVGLRPPGLRPGLRPGPRPGRQGGRPPVPGRGPSVPALANNPALANIMRTAGAA